MSMQTKLWSINALSTELQMDRRTLAKRLAGLPPEESKKVGKRIERKWKLADVIEHLNRLENRSSDSQDDFPPVNGFRMIHETSIMHFMCWLTDNLGAAWSGAMKEAGMKQKKIEELYKLQYGLMMHYMQQYLSQDEYNKQLKETNGMGFDGMHQLAHNESVTSSPLDIEGLHMPVPEVILAIMTKEERKEYDKLMQEMA